MPTWIPSRALADMASEADHHAPLETGGALMGYQASDDVVVTTVVGAGPGAVRQHRRFLPDADFQETEIARHYEASRGLDVYLGDWHSHPEGSITLSRLDRRTLGHIAHEPSARCPRPVMLILAGGDPWRWQAWRWGSSRLRWTPAVEPITLRWYTTN
jgi:integrative and conjugative element protein (TIGR02256 family)